MVTGSLVSTSMVHVLREFVY